MATLPKTIIESAEIDGASHFQTFWRLIVPMSVPALAAFAIFQFLWVWNDLLIALLFLGTENAVVTVQLQQLLGRLGEGGSWSQRVPSSPWSCRCSCSSP
jgi:alpha-glucoside transport system permease protein